MFDLLIAPFIESDAMRRALLALLVLTLGAGPVGVFLMLRRMSLAGDALSHAILPGVAAAFLLSGLAAIPMMLGGLVAGLAVALLSGLVTRLARQRSLALGVLLVGLRGGELELEHVLFGDILGLTRESLLITGVTSMLSLVGMALIWRPLVAECLDPGFLRSVSSAGRWAHMVFLVLVVLNLVGAFQAMGSLLAVGLMMLPAAAAKFWVRSLEAMTGLAMGIGMVSGYVGLVAAFHLGVDPAPSIILVAGLAYVGSIVLGRRGIIFDRVQPARHRTA
jgi:zinc/manganese transport system permease protein